MIPRPRWRWYLWCALNELSIRTDWQWVCRAWSWAILPAWLGDYEPGDGGDGGPF
jgi:hypothetical protein